MDSIPYDFYSDTLSKPTQGMREFMCRAEVGDEQRFEDPTTNRLQDMVAELLNKEAGLYMPSGTMCNETAYLVQTKPGDEIIMHDTGHPSFAEAGAPAVLGGISIWHLKCDRGIFTGAQVEEAIRPPQRIRTHTRLVSVEQTTNIPGGCIWSLEEIQDVARAAKKHNLYMHMDGARLLNASVASGIPAAKYAEPFDSVWIDFSKGLGAPVGAVLAGSREFIEESWNWKQRLGGAMRQSGIIAAACIYALEHHVERLAEDHENAKYFAQKLQDMPHIGINPDRVETNIVIFDVSKTGKTAAQIAEELLPLGVRLTVVGRHTMRAVMYLDVTRKHIDAAMRIIGEYMSRLG